jgi:hypothetical protein
VERLADPLAPVAVILQRVPKKQLMAVYKVGRGGMTSSGAIRSDLISSGLIWLWSGAAEILR